jgi:hypothetical protein
VVTEGSSDEAAWYLLIESDEAGLRRILEREGVDPESVMFTPASACGPMQKAETELAQGTLNS